MARKTAVENIIPEECNRLECLGICRDFPDDSVEEVIHFAVGTDEDTAGTIRPTLPPEPVAFLTLESPL